MMAAGREGSRMAGRWAHVTNKDATSSVEPATPSSFEPGSGAASALQRQDHGHEEPPLRD